jgi:hypothetical protein
VPFADELIAAMDEYHDARAFRAHVARVGPANLADYPSTLTRIDRARAKLAAIIAAIKRAEGGN